MKININKSITKIIIILSLLFGFFLINTSAGTTNFEELVGSDIKGLSNELTGVKETNGDIVKVVKNTGMNILGIIKTILEGVLLIYIIYIGIQMVISMGTDEDKLTKGKSQLRYSLVAIMFINIPGTIYKVINSKYNTDISQDRFTNSKDQSILVNTDKGTGGLGDLLSNIVSFIEVIIFGLAIFTIVMHGIKIMASRGREEEVTKAKAKILYSLIAGIFVGFIEGWRRLAMSSDLSQGGELFGSMTKIALVFAGPVAIFFLTLAGYYYITANGDEDRTKKAKSIIINTIIGVILLGAMFTFLNDLVNF